MKHTFSNIAIRGAIAKELRFMSQYIKIMKFTIKTGKSPMPIKVITQLSCGVIYLAKKPMPPKIAAIIVATLKISFTNMNVAFLPIVSNRF